MQDVDFILDGVLLHKINNEYIKVLQGEDKKYFKEVLKWKNLKLNKTHDGTTAILSNKGKQYVVLASSGFMVNGRVCEYLQQFLGSSKDYVCATGYCGGVGSIGYQILDASQPVVKVNGVAVCKSAHIYQLKTFSSHIQFDELIDLFRVRIERSNYERDNNPIHTHESEIDLDDYKYWDYVIQNDTTLDALKLNALVVSKKIMAI